MAAGTLYSDSEPGTRCRECHAPIARRMRFCDRCRARRRALTFARQAHDLAVDAGSDAAAGHLGVAIGILEAAS